MIKIKMNKIIKIRYHDERSEKYVKRPTTKKNIKNIWILNVKMCKISKH